MSVMALFSLVSRGCGPWRYFAFMSLKLKQQVKVLSLFD